MGLWLATIAVWETGETTPDSKFLLGLLNGLDIRDVVDVTKWNEDWDSEQKTMKNLFFKMAKIA